MPIATPEIYAAMLDRAKAGAFAYPAINVSSSQTLNAALRGFAQAKSDGIVQVSTGGASYLSGVDDMVTGATALAEYAHVVAARYPVQIALHTDHCPKDRLDRYVRPLIKLSQERVARGQGPLFQSHVGRLGAAAAREPRDCARAAGRLRQGQDRARAGDRRGGRRRRRHRGRHQREALLHAGGCGAHRGGAGHRRPGALSPWPPRSATCTASISPGTSSSAPQF
jgi:Fructose-bisphosphate aldolase class-II